MYRVLLVLLILELKIIFRTSNKFDPDTPTTGWVMKHFRYSVMDNFVEEFRMGHQNFGGNIISLSGPPKQLLYDGSINKEKFKNLQNNMVFSCVLVIAF